MKKHYFFFILLAAVSFLFSSSSNNPPNGRTGAPGDGLCTDCHSSAGAGQDAEIEVAGLPDLISPGSTYRISVTVRNPNGLASLAGFQMTILDESNALGGTLSNAGENATITSASGREYFEHNPAVAFPGSNEVSWAVDWTAPSGPLESKVNYYVVGNAANGNGQSSGDVIVTATGSVTISETSAVRDLATSMVRVYPNPAVNVLNLETDGMVVNRMTIFDPAGNEVIRYAGPDQTQIDVSRLDPGIYFLQVWADEGVETVQWLKM